MVMRDRDETVTGERLLVSTRVREEERGCLPNVERRLWTCESEA